MHDLGVKRALDKLMNEQEKHKYTETYAKQHTVTWFNTFWPPWTFTRAKKPSDARYPHAALNGPWN